MIVVSGLLADAPVQLLCRYLALAGWDYVFLDQAQLSHDVELSQRWGPGGRISGFLRPGSGRRVDFAEITGVYIRYCGFRQADFLPQCTAHEKELVLSERMLALSNTFDFLPCAVVNPLRTMASNDSKPVQGLIAKSFGLSIPCTLLTSEPDQAREFLLRFDGEVIYKSASSARSVVHKVTASDALRLELIRHCPVQFQELIRGANVRVHVIGDRVFANRIDSQGLDYRYAHSAHEAVSLPAQVQGRLCLPNPASRLALLRHRPDPPR